MKEMIKERAVRYSYHIVYQINKSIKRGFFDFNKEIITKKDILCVENIIENIWGDGIICGNGTRFLNSVEVLDWHLLETKLDEEERYDLMSLTEQ